MNDTMSLICSSPNGLDNATLLQVIGDTSYISEFLNFGFYDSLWYYSNEGLVPRQPRGWMVIYRKILMLYLLPCY